MKTTAERFAALSGLIHGRVGKTSAGLGLVDYPVIELEMERDDQPQFPSRYVIFALRLDDRRVCYEVTPMLKPEHGDASQDVWRSAREHQRFCRIVRGWRDWLRPRLRKLGLRLGRRVESVYLT